MRIVRILAGLAGTGYFADCSTGKVCSQNILGQVCSRCAAVVVVAEGGFALDPGLALEIQVVGRSTELSGKIDLWGRIFRYY